MDVKRLRDAALREVRKLAGRYVLDDREEDDVLGEGSIQELIADNVVTVDQLSRAFRRALLDELGFDESYDDDEPVERDEDEDEDDEEPEDRRRGRKRR